MPRPTHPRRHGATTVECALVFPVLLLLLFGLLVGAWGVFRYQEIASLTREAARFASVRGQRSEIGTGAPAATPEIVYNEAIKPRLVGLDPAKLTYQVTWDKDNRPGNLVTVRVDYKWVPEAYLGGVNLSSTSTAEVEY